MKETHELARENGITPGWCDFCHLGAPRSTFGPAKQAPDNAAKWLCYNCYQDTTRTRKTVLRAITRRRKERENADSTA